MGMELKELEKALKAGTDTLEKIRARGVKLTGELAAVDAKTKRNEYTSEYGFRRQVELRHAAVEDVRQVAEPWETEAEALLSGSREAYTRESYLRRARFAPETEPVPKVGPLLSAFPEEGKNPASVMRRREVEERNMVREHAENTARTRWRLELPTYNAGELADLARDAARDGNGALLSMIDRETRTRKWASDVDQATARSAVMEAVEEIPLPEEIRKGVELVEQIDRTRLAVVSAANEVGTGKQDLYWRDDAIREGGRTAFLEKLDERREAERNATEAAEKTEAQRAEAS